MWTRRELKQEAKKHLHGKYWMAFAVSLIAALIGGGRFSWSYNLDSSDLAKLNGTVPQEIFENWLKQANQFLSRPFAVFAIVFGLLAFIFSILFFIFVSTVVEAGANRWFSRSREVESAPSIGQVFSLFRSESFMPTVAAQFWKNLFLFLWSLLPMVLILVSMAAAFIAFVSNILPNFDLRLPRSNFFYVGSAIIALVLGLGSLLLAIPVINRQYAYRMVPWILGDNPRIGRRRALRLSIAMTRGHKMDMFVLDLSFIGWFLLGVLACGVGVLFVIPYYQAVQAELYAKLRGFSVDAGLASMEEYGFIRVESPA